MPLAAVGFLLWLFSPLVGLAAEETADLQSRVRDLIAQFDGAGMENQVRARNAMRRIIAIGQPAVPQLLEATRHRSPWVRLWSVAALCEIGDRRAIEPSLALMDDPNPLVRQIAIWHGSRFYDQDARVPETVLRHMQDESREVRYWARRAIVDRKMPGLLPRLEAMLASSASDARLDVFITLAMMQGRNIRDAAVDTIRKQPAAPLLATAYRALQYGRPDMDAVEMLLAALDHPDPEVKDAAVQGLEWVLKEGSKALEEGEKRAPPLTRAEQRRVEEVLERKLPPLLTSEFAPLRAHALYLLAAGRREALLPEIQKALNDPEPVVRAHALRSLARAGLKGRETLVPALAALSDPDEHVRTVAFNAILWATERRVPLTFKPDAPEAERETQAAQVRQACRQFLD